MFWSPLKSSKAVKLSSAKSKKTTGTCVAASLLPSSKHACANRHFAHGVIAPGNAITTRSSSTDTTTTANA